jgi:hypothetical protein
MLIFSGFTMIPILIILMGLVPAHTNIPILISFQCVSYELLLSHLMYNIHYRYYDFHIELYHTIYWPGAKYYFGEKHRILH